MGAAYFYHLTRSSAGDTVQTLVGKSLAAGWRVVIRGGSGAALERLDDQLWLRPEDGFVPHGRAGGAQDAAQPVLLTSGDEIPNGANCLMVLDGAEAHPDEVQRLARVCILFDGHDTGAVNAARAQWRALTGAGCAAQYWAESDDGWQKKHDTEKV